MTRSRRRSLPAVIATAGVLALASGCGQGGVAPDGEPAGAASNLPQADEPADLVPAVSRDEQVDVPAGHYDGVLLTKDTMRIEVGDMVTIRLTVDV